MTVYSDREASIHDGEPIECYEFVGPYKTYRFTSSDVAVIVNGNEYKPAAIERTEIKAGVHDEDNLEIKISIPITSQLVKDYAFQVTPPRLTLTLYRVHRGTSFASDFAIAWKGDVTSMKVENNKATIAIPSIFGNALAGNIPAIVYQTPCNRVLFDEGCKVSRAANSHTTTVQEIDGSSILLASVGGWPDGSFIGGEIADLAHNNRRMITAHASNLIVVNYPFANLTAGMEVVVTRGCDHAFNGDCKNKYANQINFGGFPFIPSINVFESGL